MALPQSFTLNNGLSVPAVGLGTFQGDAGNSQVKDVVLTALRLGYRHIDGASAYGNEKEIGEGVKESGVAREEIFVTTKLAQTWHEPRDVERALDLSLKNLGLRGKCAVGSTAPTNRATWGEPKEPAHPAGALSSLGHEMPISLDHARMSHATQTPSHETKVELLANPGWLPM